MSTPNIFLIVGIAIFAIIILTYAICDIYAHRDEKRHNQLVSQSMCPMAFSRSMLELRWLENYIRNGFDNYVDKHKSKSSDDLYRAFWDGCIHITVNEGGVFDKVYIEFNRKNYLSFSDEDVELFERAVYHDYPAWSNKIRLFVDTSTDEQYGILSFETMYASAKPGDIRDRGPVKFSK